MPELQPRLRAVALVSAGALGVHELRYLLGYGDHSAHALAEQGHAYLGFVGPVLGLVLALAFGCFIGQLVGPPRAGHEGPSRTSLPRLWACASVALLSIYVGQESIEGLLTPDHPVGLAGVFGHGGWWGIVLSLAIGLFVALLLRGADVAIAYVAGRRRPVVPRFRSTSGRRSVSAGYWPRVAPLAASAAPRAPPRLVLITS